MGKARISIWLVIFMTVLILFNVSFRMVYTPAGQMGEISSTNLFASAIYLTAWLVLSVVSGIKKRQEILVAALIYSAMPLLGVLGGMFGVSPLVILIMFLFYWTVPIQGIFIGNEQLIAIGTVILQPLIFLIGYFVSQYLRTITGSKEF